MKKTRGVDLDDVLAEFHETFIEFWNKAHGTSFTKENFNHPDINAIWGVPTDQIMERVSHFDIGDAKKRIPPRAGAQAMIARLAQVYDLHIITNRPIDIKDNTLWWLEKHFPRMFADVHFCSKKSGNTITQCKSAVCKHIGAPIILEDHFHNMVNCATQGIHVYLFDQPWNRHELPSLAGKIVRVSCWKDKILETLFE